MLVCHPDDEVLGCGGVICKHVAEGDEVHVAVVSVASEPEWDLSYRNNKLKEQEQVDEYLGITSRHHFNIPVLEMNTIPRGRFNYMISDYINELQPDIVYTHWYKDLNEQHQLVGLAGVIGTRLPMQCKVLMFENESTRYSLEAFRPNYYVSLTSEYLNKKCNAFEFYKSEQKEAPHPRSIRGIWNQTFYRGHEVGLNYAEAFYLVRVVVK